MSDKLVEWISSELNDRQWSIRQLARRSGISHTTISQVLSRNRLPGWDFCLAIARGFNVLPEDVLRQAELLPPKPDADPEAELATFLFNNLSPDEKKLAIKTLRAWVKDC